MTYYYEIETRDGTVDYELAPTWEEVKNAIMDILSKKTPKELFNILNDVADIGANLELYFYDELKEYFEEEAHKRYKDSEQERLDYYYDYYNDKL